jgi:hypothetical protein
MQVTIVPQSTRKVALVADATDLVFAGPQDGVGGVVAAASVGLNVAFALGSATTLPRMHQACQWIVRQLRRPLRFRYKLLALLLLLITMKPQLLVPLKS